MVKLNVEIFPDFSYITESFLFKEDNMFTAETQLNSTLKEFCTLENGKIRDIRDINGLRERFLEKLVETSTLSENPQIMQYI